MGNIDLVITYLDSSKKNWQEDFKKYQKEEISKGIQSESNRQAFGSERIRDWETLKYYLRGVEKNLKWVNRVILVVYDKYQIPDWLNLNCPKIKVVEHKEFIPNNLLPTFNGIEIGMYISNIKDLSDFYIMSDDDYYFINETPKDMFFRDGKTVQMNNKNYYRMFDEKFLNASDGVFYSILNNNLEFETKYMGENKVKYWISHLPEARDKSLEQKILNENKELFEKGFMKSRFRHKDQYSAQIFPNILKITGNCVFDSDISNYCKYVTLKSTVDFDQYKDYRIVCFNDTEQLDDFYITKKKLLEFLGNKLPEKSSFEK